MNTGELISRLRSQSTVKLLVLSLITLGVYESYYIKKQTRTFNEYLSPEDAIPTGFVGGIILLAWVAVLLFIPYLLVEKGHPIEHISNFIDMLWMILVLIWSFKARNRMNLLLGSPKGDPSWFKGFWTLLFGAFYFNFKVNTLFKILPNQGMQQTGTPAADA